MFSVLALAVYQKFDTWLAATLYQSFEKCQLPYIKASIVGRDLYQSFDIWTRAIEIYYISRMPREPLGALGSPWEPLGALGNLFSFRIYLKHLTHVQGLLVVDYERKK